MTRAGARAIVVDRPTCAAGRDAGLGARGLLVALTPRRTWETWLLYWTPHRSARPIRCWATTSASTCSAAALALAAPLAIFLLVLTIGAAIYARRRLHFGRSGSDAIPAPAASSTRRPRS